MTAAKLNLPAIEKGATYRHTLIWKDKNNVPVNLTDCTAKIQVREDIASDMVLLEVSTENSYLVITSLSGKIDFYIPDEDTKTLLTEGGVYDLEIYHPNGDVTRLSKGTWIFIDEVTRD